MPDILVNNGPELAWEWAVQPASHSSPAMDDVPLNRKLRVYALDPSHGDGNAPIATLSIPFSCVSEGNGFQSRRFTVEPPRMAKTDFVAQQLASVNVNSPLVLVESGYSPSLADPRFVAQTVFAIAHDLDRLFSQALGRLVLFCKDGKPAAISLHPWVEGVQQAWYQDDDCSVHFGCFQATASAKGYPPGALVYTALSYDIVVHELCHAYLDNIRRGLSYPINADVAAFHEAFADLVVIFQRLTRRELVSEELAKCRGDLSRLSLLQRLASGFSETSGMGRTLRVIDGADLYPTARRSPHALGLVLVQAVCRAYRTVAERRIARIRVLATGGTGILPDGVLNPHIVEELANTLCRTAATFLNMIIRALDYCPPIGISFFDFLTAVISADARLVPDDQEAIREAWMDAFRQHQIFPTDGQYFACDALTARIMIPHSKLSIRCLSFANTAFAGDPGLPLASDDAKRQATRLIASLKRKDWQDFLARPDGGCGFGTDSPVRIRSIRNFARPGPQGLTDFGTVVELVQFGSGVSMDGCADATAWLLIFDSAGTLFARSGKRCRLGVAEDFAASAEGRQFWVKDDGRLTLAPGFMMKLCSD